MRREQSMKQTHNWCCRLNHIWVLSNSLLKRLFSFFEEGLYEVLLHTQCITLSWSHAFCFCKTENKILFFCWRYFLSAKSEIKLSLSLSLSLSLCRSMPLWCWKKHDKQQLHVIFFINIGLTLIENNNDYKESKMKCFTNFLSAVSDH